MDARVVCVPRACARVRACACVIRLFALICKLIRSREACVHARCWLAPQAMRSSFAILYARRIRRMFVRFVIIYIYWGIVDRQVLLYWLTDSFYTLRCAAVNFWAAVISQPLKTVSQSYAYCVLAKRINTLFQITLRYASFKDLSTKVRF